MLNLPAHWQWPLSWTKPSRPWLRKPAALGCQNQLQSTCHGLSSHCFLSGKVPKTSALRWGHCWVWVLSWSLSGQFCQCTLPSSVEPLETLGQALCKASPSFSVQRQGSMSDSVEKVRRGPDTCLQSASYWLSELGSRWPVGASWSCVGKMETMSPPHLGAHDLLSPSYVMRGWWRNRFVGSRMVCWGETDIPYLPCVRRGCIIFTL